MDLSNLPKIVRRKQRIGRGEGSGRGKTSTRGQKGQRARNTVRRGFEGGQMPLYRRLPKGGFKRSWKKISSVVHLRDLNRFSDNEEVTPEKLLAAGLIRRSVSPVKILADGVLKRKLKISVHRVSDEAKKAIEAAGGTVSLIS